MHEHNLNAKTHGISHGFLLSLLVNQTTKNMSKLNNPTETWKPIRGYEWLYEISSLGNIKSLNFGKTGKSKLLKPAKTPTGYLFVALYNDATRKQYYIHRLVAMHFLLNRYYRSEINHKNGIKSDNMVDNLEWCTRSQNCKHAFSSGLRNILEGESANNSKLSISDIPNIRNKYKNHTAKKIADEYNVTASCIYAIVNGYNWTCVK